MAATGMLAFSGDPRINAVADAYILPQHRLLQDPDISFEEYYCYVLQTRAEEDTLKRAEPGTTGIVQVLFSPKVPPKPLTSNGKVDEKGRVVGGTRANSAGFNLADQKNCLNITTEEGTNTSRAFRTATWLI